MRLIPAKVFPAPTPETYPVYRFLDWTNLLCSGVNSYSVGLVWFAEVEDNSLTPDFVFLGFFLLVARIL